MRSVYLIAIIAAIAVGSLLLVNSLLAQGESTPDKEIGLSKVSVFDTPVPDRILWNTTDPGDLALPPRSAPEHPPVIPHGVPEFLPITFEDNQCIDCHAVETKESGEATPITQSHYEDLRNSPGTFGDTVVGARFNCVSCHVSLSDNALLVDNFFAK